MIALLKDLDNSISFSKHSINEEVISKLKEQKQAIKNEILATNNNFICYSLDEKSKAIAIIEDSLEDYEFIDQSELNKKQKELSNLKKKILDLQNRDDRDKISKLSVRITDLYKSAFDVSAVQKKILVGRDLRFRILKREIHYNLYY